MRAAPILAGDLRALARAATFIENHARESEPLLRELFPHSGRALIVGITGAPGAGKSTLVDHLIRLLRAEGRHVGVIAVDPSSPWSGGAILGDRVRMQRHHDDAGVFIRSMATRGCLGGVARATMDTTVLLDAAGFDTILIETVGVGQDEVEIARLAGVTVVMLVPGLGDDVQAMKAGVMEIADVFVLNKADLAGADRLEQEVRSMAGLGARCVDGGERRAGRGGSAGGDSRMPSKARGGELGGAVARDAARAGAGSVRRRRFRKGRGGGGGGETGPVVGGGGVDGMWPQMKAGERLGSGR